MHINILNRGCAKVTLSAEECAAYGIDYDSFSGSGSGSRLFVAAVIERLEEMDIHVNRCEKLTAEIFRRSGGGLIVYFSGKGLDIKKSCCESAVLCKTPREVIDFLQEIPEPSEAHLYKYMDCYALIYPDSGCRCLPPYLIAKIKEYGELLSDTPYKILLERFSL